MSAKNETIQEIVAEMIAVARANGFGRSHWADRIEAACKREAVENARLRAALKPVLEVDMSHCVNILPRCHDAVREVQRIYAESEVKE